MFMSILAKRGTGRFGDDIPVAKARNTDLSGRVDPAVTRHIQNAARNLVIAVVSPSRALADARAYPA